MAPRLEIFEEFTSRYPWCALGHKTLFTALCMQGGEAYLSYISKASLYLYKREELFSLAHTPPHFASEFSLVEEKKEVFETDELPERRKIEEEEFEMILDDTPERIVVPGGDYFGPEVLKTVTFEEKNPIDRFIKNKPKIAPVQLSQEEGEEHILGIPLERNEQEEKVSLKDVGDDNFMTETLAKIYVDQSLYQLAIKAYEKLILLYPKKSDYFAPLIQELKYKMVR